MVAIAVLAVGVLSLAQLVPFATRTDWGARTDSTATFIAMRQMEQILAQPWSVTSFIDAEDDAGNTTADEPGNPGTGVSLVCTCGAPPCTGNAGAPFIGGTETINFSVAAVVGYSRTYAIRDSTLPGTVKVNQGAYDVRWHITCNLYGTGGVGNGAGLWKITLVARPVGNLPGMIAIPAHVQAVKMK